MSPLQHQQKEQQQQEQPQQQQEKQQGEQPTLRREQQQEEEYGREHQGEEKGQQLERLRDAAEGVPIVAFHEDTSTSKAEAVEAEGLDKQHQQADAAAEEDSQIFPDESSAPSAYYHSETFPSQIRRRNRAIRRHISLLAAAVSAQNVDCMRQLCEQENYAVQNSSYYSAMSLVVSLAMFLSFRPQDKDMKDSSFTSLQRQRQQHSNSDQLQQQRQQEQQDGQHRGQQQQQHQQQQIRSSVAPACSTDWRNSGCEWEALLLNLGRRFIEKKETNIFSAFSTSLPSFERGSAVSSLADCIAPGHAIEAGHPKATAPPPGAAAAAARSAVDEDVSTAAERGPGLGEARLPSVALSSEESMKETQGKGANVVHDAHTPKEDVSFFSSSQLSIHSSPTITLLPLHSYQRSLREIHRAPLLAASQDAPTSAADFFPYASQHFNATAAALEVPPAARVGFIAPCLLIVVGVLVLLGIELLLMLLDMMVRLILG